MTWSSPDYQYTHQKTVIIDGAKAVIMTANLTSRYYSTTRDFMVIDTERADVSAITPCSTPTSLQGRPSRRRQRPGLVTHRLAGPAARPHQRRDRSLRIYSEEMGDRTIEDALVKAAKRGVDVQVCGENESGEYDSAFARLARAGVRISYYSSSAGFYIHGKVVEADYGTGHAKVFIGSENFSSTSLNRNRELGLITPTAR